MKKTLAILSIFLLAVMSMASATMDISIDSIAMTPSNPTEGQEITFDVALSNVGDENFSATTSAITLDFNDTTTADGDIPELLVGEDTTISFTHTYSTAAEYNVVASFTAGDDNNTNDEVTETITVTETNVAPTIDAIPDAIVVVGTTYTHTATANDANTGDTLTYSLTGPVGMTIDSATGDITWSPTTPVAATTVTVVVGDGELSASTTFTVQSMVDQANMAFVTSEIALGGRNQERNDPATGTIEIENTGTRTLSALTVTVTDKNGNTLDSEYTAFVSINKNVLTPSEKAVVTVSITVPEDADSKKTQIGQVHLTALDGTTEITKKVNMYLEAESKLEISDIDIRVNGNDEGRLRDGDRFDEVFEGDTVELTIKVKNEYGDRDDEIRDVYVEVTDDNWYIDEESTEQDIDGRKDATFTLRFTIDDEVDYDQTELFIRVYGEDNRDGSYPRFEHFDEWRVDFEIERKRDDVRITDVSFSRNPVECNDRTATLNVAIRNYGEDDQDEVFIYAYSEETNFKWNDKKTFIELDERDETERSFLIDLPNDLESGSYIFTVEVKYDISKDADEELVVLDVLCYDNDDTNDDDSSDSTDDEDDSSDGGIIIDTGSDNQGNQGNYVPTGNVVYGQPKSDFEQFTDSTAYLILLIALVVVVLAIVIGFFGGLVRK